MIFVQLDKIFIFLKGLFSPFRMVEHKTEKPIQVEKKPSEIFAHLIASRITVLLEEGFSKGERYEILKNDNVPINVFTDKDKNIEIKFSIIKFDSESYYRSTRYETFKDQESLYDRKQQYTHYWFMDEEGLRQSDRGFNDARIDFHSITMKEKGKKEPINFYANVISYDESKIIRKAIKEAYKIMKARLESKDELDRQNKAIDGIALFMGVPAEPIPLPKPSTPMNNSYWISDGTYKIYVSAAATTMIADNWVSATGSSQALIPKDLKNA